jgi:hypothetical protein
MVGDIYHESTSYYAGHTAHTCPTYSTDRAAGIASIIKLLADEDSAGRLGADEIEPL